MKNVLKNYLQLLLLAISTKVKTTRENLFFLECIIKHILQNDVTTYIQCTDLKHSSTTKK